jgi:hypothetical protein
LRGVTAEFAKNAEKSEQELNEFSPDFLGVLGGEQSSAVSSLQRLY